MHAQKLNVDESQTFWLDTNAAEIKTLIITHEVHSRFSFIYTFVDSHDASAAALKSHGNCCPQQLMFWLHTTNTLSAYYAS